MSAVGGPCLPLGARGAAQITALDARAHPRPCADRWSCQEPLYCGDEPPDALREGSAVRVSGVVGRLSWIDPGLSGCHLLGPYLLSTFQLRRQDLSMSSPGHDHLPAIGQRVLAFHPVARA